MKTSVKTGVFFGLNSGVITTLGMMIGLGAGTGLRLAVIGGILTIAVADSFSDALGIHVSQESTKRNSERSVWESTLVTFITKFVVALIFIIPVIFFELNLAIVLSIIWGAILLAVSNYFIARSRGEKPLGMIIEHLGIAFFVVVITYFVGRLVSIYFG